MRRIVVPWILGRDGKYRKRGHIRCSHGKIHSQCRECLEGRCIRCSNSALLGKVMCQRCADKQSNKLKSLNRKGLCQVCGRRKTVKLKTLCKICANKNAKAMKLKRREQKVICLTHYGKGGKLHCCWRGCGVVDSDMLSIDHINDDGAQDRRENGLSVYARLIRSGFPERFQTLCYNHQWKKRMSALKEAR